jgi:hypothetical protein
MSMVPKHLPIPLVAIAITLGGCNADEEPEQHPASPPTTPPKTTSADETSRPDTSDRPKPRSKPDHEAPAAKAKDDVEEMNPDERPDRVTRAERRAIEKQRQRNDASEAAPDRTSPNDGPTTDEGE